MELEQLFENFQYADLQWFLPVLAGVVIVVGALIIGIIRGMSAGVIIALLFGGVMSLSPKLLDALERQQGGPAVSVNSAVSQNAVDLATSAADLAKLNNDALVDLSRVLATMRTTLDGLTPVLTAGEAADTGDGTGAAGATGEVSQRFAQSLADTEERLDAVIDSLSGSAALRERLDAELADASARLQPAASTQ